jgi:hypothetical protein
VAATPLAGSGPRAVASVAATAAPRAIGQAYRYEFSCELGVRDQAAGGGVLWRKWRSGRLAHDEIGHPGDGESDHAVFWCVDEPFVDQVRSSRAYRRGFLAKPPCNFP